MNKLMETLSFICFVFGVLIWMFARSEADYWVYFLLFGIFLKLNDED